MIGSRGSQLALWQANHIAGRLRELGVETRIEIIRTTGDHLQTASLGKSSGKGLFTKEIEEALLRGVIDVAVHSLKDLPTENTTGLTIAAIPQREDPRDALVGGPLNELRIGARVATSSNRRASQLRLLREDLQIEPIRGNVDTRLRKLGEGQFDALVLAAAGLRRLGFADRIAHSFTPDDMCPAPGQGALAVQTRITNGAADLCKPLDDAATGAAVHCERAVLSELGGGCELPIGAFATVEGDTLHVVAGVFSPHNRDHVRVARDGSASSPEALGAEVAAELIRQGATALLTRSNA